MKKFYSLLISLFPLLTIAQTITQGDLPVAGAGWRVAQDSLYVDVIPAGGSGVTWDYTGLQNKVTDTVGFGAAAGTPYETSFPSANLAAFDWTTGDWTYFETNASGLYVDGLFTSATVVTLNPQLLQVPVPFTYNDTRTNYAQFVIDTVFSGICAQLVHGVSTSFVADGSGTLKTPTGTYSNVLRIFITELSTDSQLVDFACSGSYALFSATATQVTRYMYLRSGASAAYLLGIDADSLGTTSTASEYFLSAFSGVSVNEVSARSQVDPYPNPANDRVRITMSGNGNSSSVLKVYDATGREVYSNNTEGHSFVDVPVADFAGGIYYYSVNSDMNVQSGKFTVVH